LFYWEFKYQESQVSVPRVQVVHWTQTRSFFTFEHRWVWAILCGCKWKNIYFVLNITKKTVNLLKMYLIVKIIRILITVMYDSWREEGYGPSEKSTGLDV